MINRTLDRTFTMSSLIDRNLSRLIGLMHYDRLNGLLIILFYHDQLDYYTMIDWTFDRTFTVSSLIDRTIYDRSESYAWINEIFYRSYDNVMIDRTST
jgi:hypothetical protein